MKPTIRIAFVLIALLIALAITEQVLAFPSNWRLPLIKTNGFSEGRAVITNGPGEGQHIDEDAQAIDYVSYGDPWYTNRNVHAAHSGTVRYAGDAGCPGLVVGIEQSDGKASLYYHLSSYVV